LYNYSIVWLMSYKVNLVAMVICDKLELMDNIYHLYLNSGFHFIHYVRGRIFQKYYLFRGFFNDDLLTTQVMQ
jgi:hypothetical protein